VAKLQAPLFLRPYAQAAQRLAEAGHLVSMMPGGLILHIESVRPGPSEGSRARVRIDGEGDSEREAWFRHETVRAGEAAICNLVEDGALTDEPEILCVGDAETSGVLYTLPRGTVKRAKRWFDQHPGVKRGG
jgi:hypothetical protein